MAAGTIGFGAGFGAITPVWVTCGAAGGERVGLGT
jgi:hypothetical protein